MLERHRIRHAAAVVVRVGLGAGIAGEPHHACVVNRARDERARRDRLCAQRRRWRKGKPRRGEREQRRTAPELV